MAGPRAALLGPITLFIVLNCIGESQAILSSLSLNTTNLLPAYNILIPDTYLTKPAYNVTGREKLAIVGNIMAVSLIVYALGFLPEGAFSFKNNQNRRQNDLYDDEYYYDDDEYYIDDEDDDFKSRIGNAREVVPQAPQPPRYRGRPALEYGDRLRRNKREPHRIRNRNRRRRHRRPFKRRNGPDAEERDSGYHAPSYSPPSYHPQKIKVKKFDFLSILELKDFLKSPIRRYANAFKSLYDHYTEYWKFILDGGPKGYDGYLKYLKRKADQEKDTFYDDHYEYDESVVVTERSSKATSEDSS